MVSVAESILNNSRSKEVDEVNQYPAVINNATPIATELSSFFRTNKMVSTRPPVASISLISSGHSPRTFIET